MNDDFATALRRALQSTRAGDPGGATAILQSALAGQSAPSGGAGCGPSDRLSAGAGRDPDPTARAGAFGFGDLASRGGLSGGTGFGGRADISAPVPEGARVETRRIAGRDVRVFRPSPREGGVQGLVLMLHGCTQTPENFALGTGMDVAAEAAGFVVAYPAQTGAQNLQSCWNWFRPEDQTGSGGEPAVLARIARDIAAETGNEGRVYAAGLSAGGAMAAVLAETHPDLFRAVGIHSGLPTGAASDMPSAFAAMRGGRGGRALSIPGIVFHGTADATVSPMNARTLLPGDGVETRHGDQGRQWSRLTTAEGSELWLIEGAGHAWSGGNPAGSYADPAGPDASAEMLRFFAGTPPRD